MLTFSVLDLVKMLFVGIRISEKRAEEVILKSPFSRKNRL